MKKRIAIATCRQLPEPDPDQAPLLAALRRAGAEPFLVAWDDLEAPPMTGFDACVIRSTWNYYTDVDAFLTWSRCAAASTMLLNPVDAIEWNIHKGYLRDLERSGVPIVPTAWVDAGEPKQLADVMDERGWGEVVVKPAVSAASFLTRRFSRQEAAAGQAFLDEAAATRDMMIQPYLRSVETADLAERSIMWIDGAATHVITKCLRLAGHDERVSAASVPPTSSEAELADRLTDRWRPLLLYARIDLMYDDAGRPLVSELELIEPSLFFVQHPPALDRFVEALLRRVP